MQEVRQVNLEESIVLALNNNRTIEQSRTSSTMGSSARIFSLLNDCGIHIGDKIVDLTPIEFKLFLILSNNVNNPVESEKIYNDLWNESELKVTSFTLKTHISNLRRKIKSASEDTIKLSYIKGKGYCLTIPEF